MSVASEIARIGAVRSLPRECDHQCCQSESPICLWVSETKFIEIVPCLESSLERQRSLLERALKAYKEQRLMTVEKNPGPTQDHGNDTQPDRATQVVEHLVQWLELFGFDRTGYKTAGDIKQWREWFSQAKWLKVCKYKLAAFYTYAQKHLLWDDTMPEVPKGLEPGHPLHLLGGRAGRFIRRQLRISNPHRWEFLSSELLIKTGMPRPQQEELKESAKATVVTLTTPRRRDYSPKIIGKGRDGKVVVSRPVRTLSLTELIEQVERTTREIFSGQVFERRDLLYRILTPSFSANYIRSRKNFGTFGELLEREFFGRLLPTRNLRLRRVQTEEEHIGLGVNPSLVLDGLEAVRDQFQHTFYQAGCVALDEPPIAEAVPLAEALKVRVITKGPPMTQYVLAPIQKFMWRILKSHPCFDLIGGPVDEDKVQTRMGPLPAGKAWLSGDYSDATNQLHPDLSAAAWNTMCNVCGIPETARALGLRVLTDHWLIDPDLKRDKRNPDRLLPQQWGQLMGSIISFPVLCLVNAAVCRLAMEFDEEEDLSLRGIPLMVNGDDCLFPIGKIGRAAWTQIGTMAGLSPSPGKVYYSPSFCNINSTTFRYFHDRWDPSVSDSYLTGVSTRQKAFERVKCVRFGLVLGMKRSEAEVEQNEPLLNMLGNGTEWDSSIGARHRALMSECPEWCKVAVHKRFLKANREVLDAATKHLMPWYVPECYGGLGLEPISEYGPSDQDILICHAMQHPTAWRTANKPPPLPIQWKGPSKTHIHEIALKHLRKAVGEVSGHWVAQGSNESDGLDSDSLDSWVLYQHWHEVATKPDDVVQVQRTLNKNKKVRQWYLKHMKDYGFLKLPLDRKIQPRRFVHDVRIVERRPDVEETARERAFRDMDEEIHRELMSQDWTEDPRAQQLVDRLPSIEFIRNPRRLEATVVDNGPLNNFSFGARLDLDWV